MSVAQFFFSVLLQHHELCFQFLCVFPNLSVYSSVYINTFFYTFFNIEFQIVYIYFLLIVTLQQLFYNWCYAALNLINTTNISLSVSNSPGVSKSSMPIFSKSSAFYKSEDMEKIYLHLWVWLLHVTYIEYLVLHILWKMVILCKLMYSESIYKFHENLIPMS